MPDFKVEDIEDAYTYYVMILGISEDVFWNCDVSFVLSIVENKSAFDGFINYQKYKEEKALEKKHRK